MLVPLADQTAQLTPATRIPELMAPDVPPPVSVRAQPVHQSPGNERHEFLPGTEGEKRQLASEEDDSPQSSAARFWKQLRKCECVLPSVRAALSFPRSSGEDQRPAQQRTITCSLYECI